MKIAEGNHNTRWRHWVILLGVGFLFLMVGNGFFNLTNPDEIFYVQTAHELTQKQTWVTPYLFGEPQFEKPIFLYWCLRLAFLPTGVSPAAARFFPSLFGILGICAVYLMGTIGFKNARKSFWASLILMSSASSSTTRHLRHGFEREHQPTGTIGSQRIPL